MNTDRSIHREDRSKAVLRVAVPVEVDRGLESPTEPHFGKAPLFYLVDVEGEQILRWESAPNPGASLERGRGMAAAHFLVEQGVDAVVAGGLGEGPFHVLRDHLVKIYKLPDRIDVATAVRLLSQGQLEKTTSPTRTRDR